MNKAKIEKALQNIPAEEWANIAYMTTGLKEDVETKNKKEKGKE